MRSILKYTVFVVLCSLFLSLTAANAQDSSNQLPPAKSDKAIKPDTSDKSKDLKVEFLDIEGWKRSEVTKYPTPELGYSVNYDSEEAVRVTIYVYNLGMTNISNDINNSVVKNEIGRAKGDIKAVAKMGYYQDVKELKNDTITLAGQTGKMKALHTVFNYSVKGKPLISEIYLLGHKNNFIKIRATYPKVEVEAENKALADFLVEIEKLLSK